MRISDWSSDVCSSDLQWLLRTNGGWNSRPPNEHRPRRIPRAERADQPGIARDHILMVQMKGDDRPRARRIAIGVEHRRALVLPRLMAQHALRDQPVHIGVRLVQPQPAHVAALQPEYLHLLDDHVGDHRHDLLETLAAFLEDRKSTRLNSSH